MRWPNGPKRPCGTLGVDGDVEAITDYGEIAGYGVMNTPALVVGGRVVVAGRVPEMPEIVTSCSADDVS